MGPQVLEELTTAVKRPGEGAGVAYDGKRPCPHKHCRKIEDGHEEENPEMPLEEESNDAVKKSLGLGPMLVAMAMLGL